MKTNNTEASSKFESDLAQIELVRPSENFVTKGRSIINEKRKETSSLKWSPFSGYVLAFSASAIFVVGVAANIIMSTGLNFNSEISSNGALQEIKTSAHELVDSIDVNIRNSIDITGLQMASPQFAAEQFLIANCQDCHEANYLSAFIPENVEAAAEFNSVMRSNILALMANTES